MDKIKRLKRMLGTLKCLYFNVDESDLGSCGQDVILEYPMKITKPKNVFLGNNVAIRGFLTVISHTGKFIIKDNVDISQKLTIVTGNHTTEPPLSQFQIDCNHSGLEDDERDVIIEEDVWIGIGVTILSGVTIGRGSIIGACSLVNKSIPPYSIAVGNPCKIIKKKFSFEEVIEREKLLYKIGDRIPIDRLKQIFDKK